MPIPLIVYGIAVGGAALVAAACGGKEESTGDSQSPDAGIPDTGDRSVSVNSNAGNGGSYFTVEAAKATMPKDGARIIFASGRIHQENITLAPPYTNVTLTSSDPNNPAILAPYCDPATPGTEYALTTSTKVKLENIRIHGLNCGNGILAQGPNAEVTTNNLEINDTPTAIDLRGASGVLDNTKLRDFAVTSSVGKGIIVAQNAELTMRGFQIHNVNNARGPIGTFDNSTLRLYRGFVNDNKTSAEFFRFLSNRGNAQNVLDMEAVEFNDNLLKGRGVAAITASSNLFLKIYQVTFRNMHQLNGAAFMVMIDPVQAHRVDIRSLLVQDNAGWTESVFGPNLNDPQVAAAGNITIQYVTCHNNTPNREEECPELPTQIPTTNLNNSQIHFMGMAGESFTATTNILDANDPNTRNGPPGLNESYSFKKQRNGRGAREGNKAYDVAKPGEPDRGLPEHIPDMDVLGADLERYIRGGAGSR